jgi:hypothetical protein
VKKFYEDWDDDEINDFLSRTPVLVLFKIHLGVNEAELLVHGKLNEKQKMLLKICIIAEFGGKNMSEDMCIKINEYAEMWYNDYILAPKKVRVLNFSKREKAR